MKLEAHKWTYEFEPVGLLERSMVWNKPPEQNPDAYPLALARIELYDLQARHADPDNAEGVPTCIAWNPFDQKLCFWPAPASDMEATINFFPPRKSA
jgi:hypothetical protein